MLNKQIVQMQTDALAQDADIFDYDGAYDSFKKKVGVLYLSFNPFLSRIWLIILATFMYLHVIFSPPHNILMISYPLSCLLITRSLMITSPASYWVLTQRRNRPSPGTSAIWSRLRECGKLILNVCLIEEYSRKEKRKVVSLTIRNNLWLPHIRRSLKCKDNGSTRCGIIDYVL